MRFDERDMSNYGREIGLHGGMGLNGIEEGPKSPEYAEKQIYEMPFTGTESEILEQIKAFKKEFGKIVTSTEIVKTTDAEGGEPIYNITVTFDDNKDIKHSEWIPELRNGQAS